MNGWPGRGSFSPTIRWAAKAGVSICDAQSSWILRTLTKKAVSPAHVLLWVHLYCQPLVTLQHPDHLHPRTEQENSFFPLKKGCNKLFFTFIFHFHTFTSFRVHCDKWTETSTLRGPELTFLLVLCRQTDVYPFDNLGPFVPSRWVWYCA